MGKDFTVKARIEAEDAASPVVAKVEGRFSRLSAAIGGVAFGAAAALSTAVVRMIGDLGSFIRSAEESESASKRLGNALASLGPAGARVAAELEKQAEAIQKVTAYSDEAIKQGQAFAAAFIKNEDTLKRVTVAATDLSAGLGIDLETAFQLLTKASQGNTATLSRYGIVLDETVPKAARFKSLLGQVNDRFGGRAIADAQTYAGEIKKLGNAYDELKEAIGGLVTGSTTATQTVRDFTSVINATAAASKSAAESEGFWARAIDSTQEAIIRASGPLGNMIENYRRMQEARAKAAEAASKEVQAEASLMAQKTAFARRMIQLLTDEAAAHDVNAAAQIRANRIEADAVATKDVLIDAARELGITLGSETAAGIEKARLQVEALEDAWRRGVTTADGFRVSAQDVAKAYEALGKMQEAATGKTDDQAKAFEDAGAAADGYAAKLRGVMIPALQETGRQAELSAKAVAAVGAVDRSGNPITGAGTFEVGGTRFRPAGSGGSILVGSGGTFGSQTRTTTTGAKAYIYNPQSGRVEQIG